MYIEPDLVINKDFLKSLGSNAICSICSGIIFDPVQCLYCENSFCKDCIEGWINKQGKNSCPFRCTNPSFKASRVIKNLLSNLIFKCQNECKMEIPYLDLEQHYNEKCPNIKIDYKEKYYEYKQKYEDLLKKYNDLKMISQGNNLRGIPGINSQNNNFESKYHIHSLSSITHYNINWICDICKTNYNKGTERGFRCDKCDFDICLKCKLLEESGYKFNNIFSCKYDKHLLIDSTFENNNWICNICKKSFKQKTIKRFRCAECDFDICNDCKIKEELNSGMENMTLD